MGKIEEYKKKIIDDVDDFKDVSGGIDLMDKACESFKTCSGLPVKLRVCGNCKYFNSYITRGGVRTIGVCTFNN